MKTLFRFTTAACLLFSLGCQPTTAPPVADIHITNATLIDGSGQPAKLNQHLLIHNGRITAIGENLTARATRTINAAGRVVCPGFIDPHAHGNPLGETAFENFLAMGVTTIMLGQDGASAMVHDLGEWMKSVQEKSPRINIGTFVGHGTVRRLASVPDTAQANEAELDSMETLLKAAINAGAFGMSTGLEYVPGIYAVEEELISLARSVGSSDGMIMSHMRSEDDDVLEEAIDELLRQGEHCRVHISHLKAVYGKGEERAREILSRISAAQQRGIRISADVYPYTASYTGIGIVFPAWAKKRDQFEKARQSREPELKAYLKKRIEQRNGPQATLFGTGPYKGRTLAEAALEQNKTFVDILLELGPDGASGAYFVMDKTLQDVFICHPEIMICTDGSPTMRHPRGYGSHSKMIEEYVQQRQCLSLETAIYKLSGLPAKTIGISDRGILQAGMAADVLIFDPAEVRSTTEWSDPYQFAEGFDVVIVNGMIARENGQLTQHKAGWVLKKR